MKHEREYVKALYPKSKRWAYRVDRMSDSQVLAIYIRRMRSDSKKEGNK